MTMSHKLIYVIFYIAIIYLGLVFRFHDFYDAVGFRGDHPRDLYIARSTVNDGRLPLVGPQLSVENFNIPSTYYDFLALVYRFFPTPEGVTFVFACMNLLAMCCMIYLAILLMGKEAGLIMAFLFSVSGVMVSQSRMMWQPYPLTLALAFSLLVLCESYRRKSVALLFLAYLSYTFALAIYLSPVLLLPYYVSMGVRFFTHLYSYRTLKATAASFVLLMLAAAPFFGPFFLYERLRGYPSYEALHTPAFGAAATVQNAYDTYVQYIIGFVTDLFNFSSLSVFSLNRGQNIMSWLIIFLIVSPWVFKKYFKGNFINVYNSIRHFFGLPWLFMGSILILWFQKTYFTYRVHVFIPIFLLGFTFLVYLAVRSRRNIFSFITFAVLILYTAGNITALLAEPDTNRGEVELAARASMIIGYDAARSGIQANDMAVGVSHNHPIFPFLYYLQDFANYTLPYAEEGNAINQSAINYPNSHPFFYLICVQNGVRKIFVSLSECEEIFLEQNPGYTKLLALPINEEDVVIKFLSNQGEGK